METLDLTRESRRRSGGRSVAIISGIHKSGTYKVAPVSVRMAYLLSRYPAVSHTFFLQEVAGLRARGMGIETASINPPDRSLNDLPDEEAAEAQTTFYLKDGKPISAAFRLLATVLAHPLVTLRGLGVVASVSMLTLRERAYWLFYLAEALLLGRWMRQRGLNHLHVHFGGAVASVGMLTSAAWRIPCSLTIHGPEELLNTDSYHLREKLTRASFVYCVSDFCRSQLYRLTPPSQWGKLHVMRLGVDPVMLTPQSRTTTSGVNPPGQRTLELVCVGRLVSEKGHHILLEALRLLRERKVPIRLTMIGGGSERSSLEDFVSRHGLTDAVIFTSALAHAHTLAQLRRADIFALASFAEGIPVALMEAMSLGIPCVSTSISGIPELIRTGVDGILVPPANPQALADAIESLAADPALRKSLGHSGRQRIITQYNLPLNQELLAQSFEAHLKPRQAEPTR
jgi:colanic acid/amylovoran biosynthesis glycosyltransferase